MVIPLAVATAHSQDPAAEYERGLKVGYAMEIQDALDVLQRQLFTAPKPVSLDTNPYAYLAAGVKGLKPAEKWAYIRTHSKIQPQERPDGVYVQSITHGHVKYRVATDDAGRTICNCPAGANGTRCWHAEAHDGLVKVWNIEDDAEYLARNISR